MNNSFYINDIIINSAISALKIQRNDGSFPAGYNGPWNQQDTPVRVSSHWGILLLKAYEITKDIKFKIGAERAYLYLTSKEARPYNYSFHCIISKDKFTQSNGLIGQAWVIESLIEAYNYLNDVSYLNLAENLILKHNFDDNICLWNVLGLKGEILKIHKTFNQQLWFSVIAHKIAKICNNSEIQINVDKFFKRLPFFIKSDGYIKMHINERVFQGQSSTIKKYKNKIINISRNKFLNKMSKGYLSFTLLALSELYNIENDKDLWNDRNLKKVILDSLKYLDNKIFFDDKNKFGFQYNPIGFEVPFIKEKLSEYLEGYKGQNTEDWILKQLINHYDFNKMLMIKNTNDENTLASRIYELTRLQNRLLTI